MVSILTGLDSTRQQNKLFVCSKTTSIQTSHTGEHTLIPSPIVIVLCINMLARMKSSFSVQLINRLI